MSRMTLFCLAAALALGLAGSALSAPYILTTSAPREAEGAGAYMDTTFTTQAATSDTLMFGKSMDWAYVQTDPGESVTVRWLFPGGVLSQRRGTIPPTTNNARRKARYGALRYTSNGVTVGNASAPQTWPVCVPGAVVGAILTGTGAVHTVNIGAGTGGCR